MKLAEVITLPVSLADTAGMLRKLADELESGDTEADAVVVVLSGPGLLDVRGYGQCDGLQAMAYLSLAHTKLCTGTLEQMGAD